MNRNMPSPGNNPAAYWRRREIDRIIHRTSVERVRVVRTDGGRLGRKRKKYMNNTERANYRALLRAIMNDLRRELQ